MLCVIPRLGKVVWPALIMLCTLIVWPGDRLSAADAPPTSSGFPPEFKPSAASLARQRTLYVTPVANGRWQGWIVQDGRRVAVAVPDQREDVIRFAGARQWRIRWHLDDKAAADDNARVTTTSAVDRSGEAVDRAAGRNPWSMPLEPQQRSAEREGTAVPGRSAKSAPPGPKSNPAPTADEKTARPSPPEMANKAAASPTQIARPSGAEQVARLQRTIDANQQQLEHLKADINNPESEYHQAESEFKGLDAELAGQKAEISQLKEQGQSQATEQREAGLPDLEEKWKLARERFDLAIETRKTHQDQIVILQQKLDKDRAALDRLTGAPDVAADVQAKPQSLQSTGPSPPATTAAAVPAAATSTHVPTTGAPAADSTPAAPPAAPKQNQAEPATIAGPVSPVMDAAAASTAPADVNSAPDQQAPSKELLEARREASQRAHAAQEAEQQAQSITERIAALDQNVELERKLLEAARRKADIANKSRQTLDVDYQKKSDAGAPRAELRDLAAKIQSAEQRFHEARSEVRERTDRLNDLQSERGDLQAEQIAALKTAASKRRQAEQAREKVADLQNPFTVRNLMQWLIDHGPRLALIVLGMFLLRWLEKMFSRRVVTIMTSRSMRGTRQEREDRASTLVSVFRNAASVAIFVAGGLMICEEVGIAVGPLMGGAAVIGLAVAFGAQNLIRDYFYGFVILLENQYKINDVVKIGDTAGQVERITLRVTVLRDLEGRVHFIPNGRIDAVTNMTHGWSRALFEIGVAYKENADQVMRVLLELAAELRRDPVFGELILDDAEMLGVDGFGDSAVFIKFFIKTRPLKQWTVKRELLRRIKHRFDELGIEIPFPHRTVFHHNVENQTRLQNSGDEWVHKDAA